MQTYVQCFDISVVLLDGMIWDLSVYIYYAGRHLDYKSSHIDLDITGDVTLSFHTHIRLIVDIAAALSANALKTIL